MGGAIVLALLVKLSNFTSGEVAPAKSGSTGFVALEKSGDLRDLSKTVASSVVSSEMPNEVLPELKKAVLAKDKVAMNRCFQSLIHAGAASIQPLRAGLIKEADVEVAKIMADVLVGIGLPEGYKALLEATMLSENKDAKYAVLERLKTTLNEEGARTFINLALNGTGDLQVAASEFISSSGNPDLLSGLVSSASPEQQKTVAKILANSLSPSVAEVLQANVNLADETLAQAAIAGLTNQSSAQSLKLLLNSFNLPDATSNPVRFEDIVAGANAMLLQNPGKPGLTIILETLATSSESNVTRAAAIQILSNSPQVDPAELYQILKKYQGYETDQLVIPYLQKALAKVTPITSQPVPIQVSPSHP